MPFLIPKIIKEDPSVRLIVELDSLNVTYRHGVALDQFVQEGYSRIVKIETEVRTLYILGYTGASIKPVVALAFDYSDGHSPTAHFAIRPTANLLLNMLHGYRPEEYHSMDYVSSRWRSNVNGMEDVIERLAVSFADHGMSDTEEVVMIDHNNALMEKFGYTEIFNLDDSMICKVRKADGKWYAAGNGHHPRWDVDLVRAWFCYDDRAGELCFVEQSTDDQYAFYVVGSTISHDGTVGNYNELSEVVILKDGLKSLDAILTSRQELKNELIELSKPKVKGVKKDV